MLNSFYLFFFLRCPFCPVVLYSSFAEIVVLTASLHLDIAIATVFRHASLFDGTFRFIAVFANFKDKSNCLTAWHPKQNERKLFFCYFKAYGFVQFFKTELFEMLLCNWSMLTIQIYNPGIGFSKDTQRHEWNKPLSSGKCRFCFDLIILWLASILSRGYMALVTII